MAVRTRVLIVLFCLVLVSPLMLFGMQKVAKLELPSWLTTEESQYLAGGVSGASDLRSVMTLEGFSSGEFQTTLNTHLSNYIPCKAMAMLGNAAVQRGAIGVSNILFGWDCYPCYYGNVGYVVFPSINMVIPRTMTVAEDNARAAARLVDVINRAVEAYPDVTFVYQPIEDTYSTDANPSNALITGGYTPQWIEDNITDLLSKDVQVVWEGISSAADLAEGWFSTEHHWTMARAVEAYNDLAEVTGWNVVNEQTDVPIVTSWFGASARGGLDLEFSSMLYDIDRSELFENLTYSQGGVECDRGLWDSMLRGDDVDLDTLDMRYNAYHTYYGYPAAEGVYVNSGENNGKTCLVIEQSYGVPIEPLIALNYAKTIVVDPLNCVVSTSLDEYLSSGEIDDVVFQLGATYLYCGVNNSPAFFEG